MIDFLLALLAAGRYLFRSRAYTALEVLALRQQLAVLKRKHPRPALNCVDRAFWMILRQLWPQWQDALLIVKPETVVGWHRTAFRFYWRWRSRSRVGRPKAAQEIRNLIRRMAAENAGWGAPKITANSSNSGSSSQNGLSVSTCGECVAEEIQRNDG